MYIINNNNDNNNDNYNDNHNHNYNHNQTIISTYYNSFSITDPRGGPAYDLQVLRKLMSVFDVPQVVPFMCFDAREVCMRNCKLLLLWLFLRGGWRERWFKGK